MTESDRPATVLIRDPWGGNHGVTELRTTRVTIGRPVPGNYPDVALEPDPQQWVSRLHCFIERNEGAWWVIDNATVNGTFLRRDAAEPERITGPRRLKAGDVICVLGDLDEGPRFWELIFDDPFGTHNAERSEQQSALCLAYDWNQAKLFRHEGGARREIPLPPNGHKLIRHFMSRSRETGGAPVACTHEELIRAVWGEEEGWSHRRAYTNENLRDLVCDLRRKIEPDPNSPCLLETIAGYGYRLVTCTAG